MSRNRQLSLKSEEEEEEEDAPPPEEALRPIILPAKKEKPMLKVDEPGTLVASNKDTEVQRLKKRIAELEEEKKTTGTECH